MSRIEEIIQQAGALGLGSCFDEHRTILGRVEHLNAELGVLRSAAESARSALVGRLVAGESPEPSETVQVATRHDVWGYDGPAAACYVQAVAALRSQSAESARSAIGPLFAAMQEAAATTVAESARLAKSLPVDVRTERDAYHVGGGTVWAKLRAAHELWTGLHRLRERLETAELVPRYRTTREDRAGAWLFFGRPLKLPADFARVAPELRLSVAHAHGAQPGLFGAVEAMKRRDAGAHLDLRPMWRQETYDVFGAVLASVDGPSIEHVEVGA